MSDTFLETFQHGNFEISVVSDGFIVLPKDIIMPGAEKTEAQGILARMGGGHGSAPMHTNVPIITVGNERIVIDTGSGAYFQDTAGALVTNMRAAGIDPSTVTKVVYTHAHPDHAGGTTLPDTGELAFPNAEHLVSEMEWQFWVDPNGEHLIPDGLKPFVEGARRDLGAVNDRLKPLMPGDEIVSGISAVATPGHTVGHISILVDGGEQLLITGDALTNPVISFEHPEWRFGFDADHETALATRLSLLDRLSADRIGILGYHWKYPGIGFVEKAGSAYRLSAYDF